MDHHPPHPLLAEILAFCEARGIAHSTFGGLAVGDPRFVHDLLHESREPRRRTVDRVRTFMLTATTPAKVQRKRTVSAGETR